MSGKTTDGVKRIVIGSPGWWNHRTEATLTGLEPATTGSTVRMVGAFGDVFYCLSAQLSVQFRPFETKTQGVIAMVFAQVIYKNSANGSTRALAFVCQPGDGLSAAWGSGLRTVCHLTGWNRADVVPVSVVEH